MTNADTIINTTEKAVTVANNQGIANTITVIVVAIIAIYFIIQMIGSRKQWNNDSSSLKTIRDDVATTKNAVVKIPTYHWEITSMLDQILQRYSDHFSVEQCILIANSVLQGTKSRLELKAIKIIIENDIENKWNRIEIKVREIIGSHWQTDMSLLESFIVRDGKPISDYIDQDDVEELTKFLLIAIREKYSFSDIDEGLSNIYREMFASLTTKLKKEI